VGLCTAYELTQDGHEVSVFERNATVAQEASFACAGHISPSLSHPLASAGKPARSWVQAVVQSSGISVRKGVSLRDLGWLYGWKTQSKAYLDKLQAAHGLIAYSRARQQALSAQANMTYEQSEGNLLLWESEAAFSHHKLYLADLRELGVASELLTPEQTRAKEPALQADFAFYGATYFHADAVGNCRQFAHLLKEKLTDSQVSLHFGTEVTAIDQGGGIRVQTSTGITHAVDQVVLCTGSATPSLTGNREALPLTAVWSHSLSVPIRESLNAPRSAVQDMRNHISVTRLGDRVRVSGGAELGATKEPSEHAVKQMYRTLNTLFPGASDFGRSAQIWKGASLFTPDGLPLIGASKVPGIWFNLGHGHNGWSMACGSARVVADLIANKPGELDTTKLAVNRFHS